MKVRRATAYVGMAVLAAMMCSRTWAQKPATATPTQTTQPAPLDDPATAKAKYEKLAAAMQAGNLEIDWLSMRLSARVGDVGGNFDSNNALSSMYQALKASSYAEALKQAQMVEAHNEALGDAHFGAMIAYDKMGKTAESDHEKDITLRIANSIMSPGDGKTAATAWFVVWPDEEYFILRILGMQPKEQALVEQGGHSYDKMTVTDSKTGGEVVFWFNTDTDMQVLARALSESSGTKQHK